MGLCNRWAYQQCAKYLSEYDIVPDAIKGIEIPEVHLDYGQSPYNHSKVALIIENRLDGKLAPLILHMMSVIPPDWRFRFVGSEDSIFLVNSSAAIRHQVNAGKLDISMIPSNMSVAGQEQISQFLTTRWLYEYFLQPAEWLLVFQTDSVLIV